MCNKLMKLILQSKEKILEKLYKETKCCLVYGQEDGTKIFHSGWAWGLRTLGIINGIEYNEVVEKVYSIKKPR